jgi:hypothetical protein
LYPVGHACGYGLANCTILVGVLGSAILSEDSLFDPLKCLKTEGGLRKFPKIDITHPKVEGFQK